MVFNISDHIKKFKDRQNTTEPDVNIVLHILNKEIPGVSRDMIQIRNNIIFIKNISPTKKTFLKLKKRTLLKKLKESDLVVHDII